MFLSSCRPRWLIVSLALLSAPVMAQTPVAPEAGVTVEILEGRIQEVEASASLDEANKAILLDAYRKSLGFVSQRESYEASAREFITAREEAPQQARALREQVIRIEGLPPPQVTPGLAESPLAELEQALLTEKSHQSGVRANVAEIEALLEVQAQRAAQARKRLEEARQRQAEIAQTIKVPAPAGQSQRVAEARLWALQAETPALAAEIEMLNQELLSQPMRVELYSAQRDKALLELNRQRQLVTLISELVGARRASDAESARLEAEETERLTFGKHPVVQALAQRNSQLGEVLENLASRIEAVRAEEAEIEDKIKGFSNNYRLARQKLEIAGLSQALGQAMLQQRTSLPRARDFRSAEGQRQQLVVESSLRQIRNQQERTQLSNVDAFVEAEVASLSSAWQGWISEEIRELALQRRALLDQAIATDDSLLQALSELDFAQRELSKVVSEYNQFLDERLLWVRTGDPPSWQSIAAIGKTFDFFLSPANLKQLTDALSSNGGFSWTLLIGLILFAMLLSQRRRMLASLRNSGRKVGQLRHDRFSYSLRALLLTLLLALPWPILLLTIGLHLQLTQGVSGIDVDSPLYQPTDSSGQFVPSIGAALNFVALYLFYFLAFRQLCDKHGLAASHFHWSIESRELLRREILRLMVVLLPATFLVIAAVKYDTSVLAGPFTRLLVIVIFLAMAWFFVRVLSPNRGVLGDYYRERRNLVSWLRYLWLMLGLALPLALAVLTALGFVYTAVQLGQRLVDTLWLLVAIILIHQLVVRWVTLLERQLALRDALERRRAQRAARDAHEDEGAPVETFEKPVIDFGALGGDTSRLVQTLLIVLAALGVWAVWSDVLPALRILDQISLWSYAQVVEGVEQQIPVTLGDILIVLLVIVFAAVLARRMPALMEIALFARFNITAGSRYAISTLTQYTIVAVSIIMVFSVLGGSWGEAQWLIAALGVGIGFGLQEIIANFICGLILLFERPIRIGDIVTVGDTSGIVTGIRIRSTTIRNWDQQELLVPNKEFITGRLLNWTLSDPLARIFISVGIAYGSDVGKALEILLKCAEENERVLDEPAPLVTFESFGDNALDIKLRCYIDSMDYRLTILTELNLAINREMQAAGIVIAFPQRDVHLDMSQPIDLRLHRASPDPA